jgi:putative NIF3 family GTP cyclohydrolase 1 type 2
MKTKPYTMKLQLLVSLRRRLRGELEAFRETFEQLEQHEAGLPAGDPTELSGILVALDELEAQVDAAAESVRPMAFMER